MVARDESNADAWNLIGFSHRKLGRYGPALEAYAKGPRDRSRGIPRRSSTSGELHLALDDLRGGGETARRGSARSVGSGLRRIRRAEGERSSRYKAAQGRVTSRRRPQENADRPPRREQTRFVTLRPAGRREAPRTHRISHRAATAPGPGRCPRGCRPGIRARPRCESCPGSPRPRPAPPPRAAGGWWKRDG